MSIRVEVLNEVTTVDPSPSGTWNLAFQWCRYVDDEGNSFYYGYRFIWQDEDGKLRPTSGQARLHSLTLIRDLLQKAESAGWGSHDADTVCDSEQRAVDDGNSNIVGKSEPTGTISDTVTERGSPARGTRLGRHMGRN